MLSAILAFLSSLPELIKLIKNIQNNIRSSEIDRKVREDVKKINEAFEKEDADKLNRLFNS